MNRLLWCALFCIFAQFDFTFSRDNNYPSISSGWWIGENSSSQKNLYQDSSYSGLSSTFYTINSHSSSQYNLNIPGCCVTQHDRKHQQKNLLEKYVASIQNYFQGDVTPVVKAIKKAIDNQTMSQPAVRKFLQHTIISHLVKTGETDQGKVRPFKNYPWMQLHDLQQVSVDDQIMVNYFVGQLFTKANDTTVENIEQVKKFSDYTDNFKNLEKLTPQEILYLNLCDWLERQASVINAEIEAMGGLKIVETRDGITCITEIHKLDLFHSLLGEMKPGNLKKCVQGGHLFIPELRAATLEVGELSKFGDGFFDAFIRVKSESKINSYFPLGTTVQEAVDMIKDVIKNYEKISLKTLRDSSKIGFDLSKQQKQFAIIIENKIAQFYPVKL